MSSAPRTPERDQLLKGVDEIAGVIRADAAVSEELRHLPESSVEALEHAVALEPDRAEAANALSWLLLDEGRDLERALRLAERAVGATEANADFLDTQARALRALGRCAQALVQARKAAALDSEYAARRDALERECGAEPS